MTSPSPWAGTTPGDAQDALAEISQMMTGTKILQDQPGVVYSLAAAKAHPADAQAIDQFMQSLDAEKQVRLAEATGASLKLSDQQKTLLNQIGVDYSGVEYKPPVPTTQPKAPQAQHSGWFSSVGSFFGHVGNAITTGLGDIGHATMDYAVKPVLTGLNKAYNFTQAGLTGQFADQIPGSRITDVQDNIVHADATKAQDMQDQGYNPNSPWSALAFAASGKNHTDLTPLNDQYGADKVDQALQFLNSPKAAREAIDQNPASYVTDSQGQKHLTPAAQAQLEYMNSKEFETLVRKVNASQNTVGNAIANAVGIDPVSHPDVYNYTAALSNIAVSFAIDPTILTLKVAKAAKLSQIGIDSLGDSNGAAAVLSGTGRYAKRVQQGWQTGIDLAEQMRQAKAAGDTVQLAKLTSEFQAKLPALAPIMDEFIGDNALVGLRNPTAAEKAAGIRTLQPVRGETGGIQNLDDAAQFVGDKMGLSLLQNGRAATRSQMMPGTLSAVGYRQVKGAVASWMTGRSATRQLAAESTVLDRVAANPALAQPMIDDGLLRRLAPEANDAVAQDGTVIQAPVPSDASALPSQQRGAFELTAAGKGEVAYNLRKTGDPMGDASIVGWASPTAIAARARLAAQRLSTLLPRNTILDINDSATSDKIYKTALLYLNRGDAAMLRAAYNTGDGGARKAVIGGLIDQLGHAAGFGKTGTGQALLARMKTADEGYASSGSEILRDGQPQALTEGQTRQTWTLPSFRDMQKSADKLGLWDGTMGRALTSDESDLLMSQWKMGALFKPSTVSRNMLEGWLRTILEGRAGDAIKAKALATARNKELWDRGIGVADRENFIAARGQADSLKSLLGSSGLSKEQRATAQAQRADALGTMQHLNNRPIVQHLLATERGDTELARKIEKGSLLSGDTLGRSVTMTKLADLAPLAAAGRAYRSLVGRHMDPEMVEALMTLGADDLAKFMEGYGQQALETDLGFANSAKHATAAAQSGWGPSRLRFMVKRAKDHGDAQAEHEGITEGTSWTHHALDGTVGVDRYANALGRLTNLSPETAKASIAYLEDPPSGIDQVVSALEKEKGKTGFGTVYFEDPYGQPNQARTAVNDAEKEVGKRDWAHKVADEYAYLLHSRPAEDGSQRYLTEIADYIKENGHAPSADWIADNIKAADRPESALAPEVMAQPSGGIRTLPQTLQDIEGGAYQWLVERPLQRTTSSPVFLANYAIARKGLNGDVEKMVDAGLSREAAEELAKELSVKNAWVKTEQLIDDPGQKTQFDVIARNFFPFSRATQAMIRRWGTGLWQNPAAARKMMLAYEGAQHSGFIYNNAYGEPTFTYPGSGVMNMTMREISKIPGFGGIAQFPVSGAMTGGVLMSVPGADNPFRMSAGPMISVPMRLAYENLLPTSAQGSMLKLDEFINGPVGAGETFNQFVPTILRHYFQNVSANDRNSALVSSMNGAFANLAAAGLIPPPDASPSEVRQFRARLQTQVHNQLIGRFVFGLFAPAAPSQPTEAGPASGADFAWSVEGVKGLSDEYKSILNDVKGDVAQANAVFTALHPDEVIYGQHGKTELAGSAFETTGSKSLTKGAYLPSTDSALQWLTSNQDFVKKYGTIAAYFLPTPTSNEPFSEAAYKAQLEMGLRQKKMPDEFMSDVYLKHAENTYYPVKAKFDELIALAKAQGMTQAEAQYTQEKSDWEKQYKSLNVDLGAKLSDYGPARQVALGQLADIRKALQDRAIPDGLGEKVQQLVEVWDNYDKYVASVPGNTAQARGARAQALAMFDQWAVKSLAGTPIADLYNGVFRVLNTNIAQLPTTTGG